MKNAGPEPARYGIYDWKTAGRFNRKTDFAAIDRSSAVPPSPPALPHPQSPGLEGLQRTINSVDY
jgi:hypothetical protein